MRARAVGTLLVTMLASAIPCSAADTDWTAALKTYAGNPYQNRGVLVRLGHRAGTGVPPLFVLALADAELRAKRFPQARARFTKAINSGLAVCMGVHAKPPSDALRCRPPAGKGPILMGCDGV